MNTKLITDLTVGDICDGFVYDELEGKGLFGLAGRLTIQPEFQRNYIYADGKRDAAVIRSVVKGYPLGLLYFSRAPSGQLEVLDGQQRITSLGRFVTNKLSLRETNGSEQFFGSMSAAQRDAFLSYKILAYECDGTEEELREWFQTINIAGVPLNDQELRNAIYCGAYISAAKAHFSNSNGPEVSKWENYVRGSASRQDFLERALEWVSDGEVDLYLAKRRNSGDIRELKNHFTAVIEWVSSTFPQTEKEMKGLEWGRLYKQFHHLPFPVKAGQADVESLYSDPYVKNRKGVFEYVLGGKTQPKLLEIRLFDDAVKARVYKKQKDEAIKRGKSNCPDCCLGHDANKTKIWLPNEMDADHVTAWVNGGSTTVSNCQMLCRRHNQAKGNK